jgi:hypothetical protein
VKLLRCALLLFFALPASAQSNACDAPWPMRTGGAGAVVLFRTEPATLVTGRHFELQGVLCPAQGANVATTLKVDAEMPAHRHGMNYRTTTQLQPDGRFKSQGLLLHMPGRWRFIFDITGASGSQRLTHDIDIE